MSLLDIPLYVDDKKDKEAFIANKKQARETVKRAIHLYNQGEVSEELLKSIAELALAIEMLDALELKFDKADQKFLEKFKRLSSK
jgi:hypothetical protein